MGAATQALLFYGAVSDGFDDVWKNLSEERAGEAKRQGLSFGMLRDGEVVGFYLAVVNSVTQVDAGESAALVSTDFVPPWQWRDKIQEFAASMGLPLQTGEPKWYLACRTDRDY